uniref:Uncharacterized protein n=1 Tax=Romanomermis culicivorax TaxID=13658 RepID=A0A915HNG4_ROMCU
MIPNITSEITLVPETETTPDSEIRPRTSERKLQNCIELVIINIVEGKCPLLFINNSANGIRLQPNQLITEVKFRLEEPKMTVAWLRDYEDDHQPAALVNDQSTKLEEEKL